jgi:hypothetical protein
MKTIRRRLAGAAMAVLVAAAPAVLSAGATRDRVANIALGAGHYLVAGSLDVVFAFAAVSDDEGHAGGAFHVRTNDGLGSVEFHARVTCLAVDKADGRAWIGGVILTNLSTSPDFTGGVYEPGHDIWFRVLDGDGAGAGDRSTFVGFEGAIPSSAAYCASQPWPADNARTWPVTHGHILVW